MKFGSHCENAKFQMGDYQFKTHMFSIDMGGCDIVLRGEWLRTLRAITMIFKELDIRFVKDSHTHTLKGIRASPPKIIICHDTENILNKGQ